MISMKCYYTLFTKEGIYKNIGNYILLFIILLFLISGICFYKCGYISLEDVIKEIIALKEEKSIKYNNIKETNDIKNEGEKKEKKSKMKKKKKKIKQRKTNKSNIINISDNKNHKSFSKLELINSNRFLNSKNELNINSQTDNAIRFNDFELNSLSYINSIKYDKRTFLSYYNSLIRTKQPIIFSFCPIKDYNSIIIKIDLFFLFFAILYFINALFFEEKTFHKIYMENGIYNFAYFIRFISYSFIISHILMLIIKYFSLSERNILEIKNEKIIEKANDKIYSVKKCLIIKYISFFISGTLFLLFLWYYLSSFGAVYQNTQIFVIKNTLISFGFSLVYPFIINLIPGILRIYSLKNNKRKCIFQLSKIIQFI